MIRVIHRKDSAGNWIFVAAFANDDDLWDGDVAETYAENLRQEGHEVKINETKLNNLPSALRGVMG